MRETRSPLRLFPVSPRRHNSPGETAEQAGVLRCVVHSKDAGDQRPETRETSWKFRGSTWEALSPAPGPEQVQLLPSSLLQREMGQVPPPSPGLTAAATWPPTPISY